MRITCEHCLSSFEFDSSSQPLKTDVVYCPHCYHQNYVQAPSAFLRTILEDGSTQYYPLGSVNSLGRHPNNTIQIMDRMISKHHARIILHEGTFVLEDLKSRNGTFVNDQRVTNSLLSIGDEVRLGKICFYYQIGDTSPSASLEQQLREQVTIIGEQELNAQIAQIRHEMAAKDFLPEKKILDVETLRKDYEKLRIAHELNRKIGLELDQDILFSLLLEETFKLVPADRGVILMHDQEGEWVPKCLKERNPEHKSQEGINISKTILQTVVEHREAVLSSDAKIDERFSRAESVIMQGIRSSMSIPLISRSDGEILSVMHLDTQNAIGVFTEKDLQLMSVVASQAADALDNARMARKIDREGVIRTYLQRFLSPAVMQRIKQDDLTIRMGGEMVEATMMFTDIRGFTSLSETYDPHTLIQEINAYFDLLVDVIFSHEGTLDKFIGDAIMAVWGTPETHDDDSLHAVQAAVEIQKKLNYFNKQRVQNGSPPFYTGIGINTGRVVAGNMGSPKRLEFTVLGDGVNLASRLCSKAKANEVIITESTFSCVKDYFRCTQLPPTKVKGKSDPLSIYRVEGYSDTTQKKEEDENTSTRHHPLSKEPLPFPR